MADSHHDPLGGRGRELGIDMPSSSDLCGGCDYQTPSWLPGYANKEQELGRDLSPAVAILLSLRNPGSEARSVATALDNASHHSKEFSGALSKAVEWLESRGFKAERATLGKFGDSRGIPVGMQTMDGKVGFRVEYDVRSGAHINVWSGKEKGPHYSFDGTQKMVDKIVNLFR